jgi:hypothetical protein
VPRLTEQHHIVAAIETHFSRLDAAVASLTRAKANVKRASEGLYSPRSMHPPSSFRDS